MNENFLFNLKTSTRYSYKLLSSEELRKKGEKFSLVSDAMFEAMINNEKRKKFGAYLIALAFKLEYKEVIKSIRIEKEKLDKDKAIDAKRTVDFVCSINDEFYSIEMNNCPSVDSLIRNIYYAVDISKSRMRMGTGYEYKKVMQINLCNFTFKGHDEITHEYAIRDKSGLLITDKINFLNIYLPNIRKKCYDESDKLTTLEKLLIVYCDNNEVAKKFATGDEIMEDYIKEANDASIEDEIVGLYDKELDDRLKWESFQKQVYKDAAEMVIESNEEFAKGTEDIVQLKEELAKKIEEMVKSKQEIERSKKDIAKKLLDNNIDIDIIMSSTGLTKEEI